MLASLSRFIIADLTEQSSTLQELHDIVPDLAVPVQLLLQETKQEYSRFIDFRKYPWVLPIHYYQDQAHLLASLKEWVFEPAERKVKESEKR